MSAPKTLDDKIWDSHVVDEVEDGTCILYIDRHLVHEVIEKWAKEKPNEIAFYAVETNQEYSQANKLLGKRIDFYCPQLLHLFS